MPVDPQKAQEIIESRRHVHGVASDRLRRLGEHWRALLEDHFGFDLPEIPAYVTAAMLTQQKLCRVVTPVFNEDDYLDATNYLGFAYDTDPNNPENLKKEKGKCKRPPLAS